MTREESRALVEAAHHTPLSFRTARHVRSSHVGDSASRYIGEGLEFEELRPFRPGDRVRHVHPAASSKAQELLVKRFLELREALVLIVLDLSPSMQLRDKLRTALTAAGVVAHSAFAQHMPLGAWIVGGTSSVELTPRAGQGHFHRVLDTLADAGAAALDPTFAADHPLEAPDRGLDRLLPRGSFLFLVSDFLGRPDAVLARLLADPPHCHTVAVIVQDDLECSFPVFPRHGAVVPVVDPETLETRDLWVDARRSRAIRAAHAQRFTTLCGALRALHITWAHTPSPSLDDLAARLQDAF